MIALSVREALRPRVVPPPGWSVARVTLASLRSGSGVEIAATEVASGESLERLAERVGDRLARDLPGFRELSGEARADGSAFVTRFTWQDGDGVVRHGAQVVGRAGVVATISGEEPPAQPEVDAAATLVSDFAFGAPRGVEGTYSTEELTALAELAGAPHFPGTGRHAFESDRERDAARRALLARGALRGGEGDTLAMDPLDERTIRTALSPDATVTIEVGRAEGRDTCFVYVGEGVSVAHSTDARGIHRLEAVPTLLLAGVVRAIVRVGDAPGPGSRRLVVGAEEFRRLRETAGRPAAADDPVAQILSSVVSSARVGVSAGGRDADGEVAWIDTDRGRWLVSSDGERVTLEPCSAADVHARLDALSAPLTQARARA